MSASIFYLSVLNIVSVLFASNRPSFSLPTVASSCTIYYLLSSATVYVLDLLLNWVSNSAIFLSLIIFEFLSDKFYVVRSSTFFLSSSFLFDKFWVIS